MAKAVRDDEVEWNLISAIRGVLRSRRVVYACTLAGLVLGILIAFAWPQWYAADAVFLPPRASDTMIPNLSGAGGSAGGAGAALLLQQDPSDMYLGMLASRSVEDDVIDHLGLMAIYHAKKKVDARNTLKGKAKFKVDKNSLISIEVSAKDPKLAANIANAYLEALYRLNGSMVASSSTHRRAFYEEQMESQKEALDAAEVALKQTEEKTGIVLPEGTAQAGLRTIVDLQAAIGSAEAKLSGMRMGATEDNPQVMQARAELAELRAQLERQQADSAKQKPGTGLASSAALPGLAMELVRKMRDVKLNETLYDTLTQQYERARIESLDPGPQFQIVDRAIVPERKAGPPRKLIVLGGIVLGFLAGLGWVLMERPAKRLIKACLSDPGVVSER
ncbi:GNVR domain-containing protein [Edaphobacter paludis]|uniref:GNVR domain-containing protein n=1 Tax=Edaphobacter paludis TaxID=3035702 RepID=A0AAU7CYK8_9BACT